MRTELIISTYNSPWPLTLTLLSVSRQTRLPDAVCIADDGSGPETRETIAALRARLPELNIRHEWHEDRGFEKNRILNQAIATSDAEYLIFIDGDCLIHPCFVARHLEVARPDRFCSGSLIRLDTPTTNAVTEDDVLSGRVFDRGWLRKTRNLRDITNWLKTAPLPMPVQSLIEHLYPVYRNWCGGNASAFRSAILRVNGMDEDMKYGGGDKEFGIRLENSGVKGRHLRFTAPLVHLDHPRGYKDPEKVKAHRRKIVAARRQSVTWTAQGIVKGEEASV